MLKTIYEDEDIIVVDKPAGLSVHPDAHHTDGTLLDMIQKKYPEARLAHRLDKDTSGLLIVAKHERAYEYMKEQFKNRAVAKKYLALVVGNVTKDAGEIHLSIERSTKDFKKRVAKPNFSPDARTAETHFKVVERLSGYTLLEVSPKTGRTHQIRSHMAAIGYPVACDPLYGGKKFVCPDGLTRQFLHAYSLEFSAPNGKRLLAEIDMPGDLAHVLARLCLSSPADIII